METSEQPENVRRHRVVDTDDEPRSRDTIVIRLPGLDSRWWDLLSELMPGRRLFRVLQDLPEDVVTHTRAARREQLLALRSLVDALIEDTERPARRHRPARKVEIE
jgi:hypothetical protein